MIEIKDIDNGIRVYGLRDFKLSHIFDCGQAFRWEKVTDNQYQGIAKGKYISLKEEDKYLEMLNTSREDFYGIWYDYFDLNTDYSEIKDNLSKKDKHLKRAIDFGYGIRILNQEPFETLISFIISANNNIPRIKACVESICRNYGKEIADNLYAFPKAKDLIEAGPDDIRVKTRTGYRADYIYHAALLFDKRPFSRENFKEFTIKEAREFIMEYKGAGPKVADCILLFTGSYMDAFPIDVWVERVMKKLYNLNSKKAILDFASQYFGHLSGYGQQYLFYAIREGDL